MNREDVQRLRSWVRSGRISAAQAEDCLFLLEKFAGRRSLEAIVVARGYLDADALLADAPSATGEAAVALGDFDTAEASGAALGGGGLPEGTLIVASPFAEPVSTEASALNSGDDDEAATILERQLPDATRAALRGGPRPRPLDSGSGTGLPTALDLPSGARRLSVAAPPPPLSAPAPVEAPVRRGDLEVREDEIAPDGGTERGPSVGPRAVAPRRVQAPVASPSVARVPFELRASDAGAMSGYRLEGELARGRRALVHRARDVEGDREVALWVPTGPAEAVEAAMEAAAPRLLVAARLEHPHVVRVLDLGRAGDRRFVAFERVEGLTLEERLAAEGPLPLLDALELGRDVARGLAAVHGTGELHGDVRPDRILLGADGRARLGGFGLPSAAIDPAAPAWAARLPAPELGWGAEASVATELYALGGVLHVALTGSPPFDPTDARALTAALDRGAPDVRERRSEVPGAVASLVAELLEPSAEKRPRAAGEVAERLARAAVVTEGEGGARASSAIEVQWSVVGAATSGGLALTATLAAAVALVAGPAARDLSAAQGAAASSVALLLAGIIELMRQGQVPLAVGAVGWVRLRDACGLLGGALLLAGGIGPRAGTLDVVMAVLGGLCGLVWSAGAGLRREVARARPDRGRGRTLAVLGDLRLARWRRLALPFFAAVAALALGRWVLLVYFATPAG